MTEAELEKIKGMPSATIIAPAGHGKTEMIAEMVKYFEGRHLLLTHTNAGVDAIEKRLQKHNVPKEKYTVTTIAAFCMRWCASYSHTSDFDNTVLPPKGGAEAKMYYERLYIGTKRIFENEWAGIVLRSTYSGVIVDEYQDCIQQQHEIILTVNKYLPVRVLGDPMQGIFSFAGDLVKWDSLEFPVVNVNTQPWRWMACNPELGVYLMQVRNALLPVLNGRACTIQIDPLNKSITVVSPSAFTGYSHLKELSRFSSVVYITRWSHQQLEFCKKIPGVFQYDEKQDCDELFDYAAMFDTNNGINLAINIIEFAAECLSYVKKELRTYIEKLKVGSTDFNRIAKHSDFREILTAALNNFTKNSILNLLLWFSSNTLFKQYRSELLNEMIRSVKYAIVHEMSIYDAACHVRKDIGLQKKYTGFKFLSSRTLLSKGLEFDCVIIDMTEYLPAKDFYVAMTRAKKKIYIISETNIFNFAR